jgi:ATPase subunit of ABC transporter with duplicated ATPase domains
LLEEPDILILDEPSNDLDIDTVKWLESFISNCDKPILYVSHDEMLLSRTANAILHLELVQKKKIPKWTYKNIGYDEYVNERVNYINHTTMVAKKEKSNFDKKQEKLNKIMNKVEHQQNTISRSDPHGAKMLKRKMKSIKAQEKRMNEKELTNIPDYEESIYFSFEESNIPNKKKVIELIDYKISIDHKVLARNINLNIMGSEHIVIIGRNGCGKTTLLNSIYNLIKNRIDIKVGYMPQNYDDILSDYNSAIDFLCKDADKEYISKARSYLGNMNFTSDEMTASINDLSGGSKAKLIMIKLVLDRCNVLILDEPTRNVSPLSNPIIRETLRNFKGTIISVSHDRKYINFVCSKIYELDELGLHYISSI